MGIIMLFSMAKNLLPFIYWFLMAIIIVIFHYSTKKREHCFSILTDFFVRYSSEYETSDSDRQLKRNI